MPVSSSVDAGGIGASVSRREDLRLVRGLGRYTDDIAVEHGPAAHLVAVRSPYAFARILSIDLSGARGMPGVIAVLGSEEMAAENFRPFPLRVMRKKANGEPNFSPPYMPLAVGHVRHVGDIVAVVVAETLDQAKDAAEQVDVTYDALQPVVEMTQAVSKDAPLIWPTEPDNICFEHRVGDGDAWQEAAARAAHVISDRMVISRVSANPLEPRTALGEYDPETGRFTLHAGLQSPHAMRREIAHIFGLPVEQFRVVGPDVGGAFGMKASLHPEIILVLWAARLLQRPVRHVCERSEAFLSDHQSRDHVTDVSLALDEDGRFLGLKVTTLANIGAYIASNGLHSPTNNLGGLAGVYTIGAFDVVVRGVFTNTLPTCPYRGAGRPEATFYIEQIIDKAAYELGVDRVEIRRRNLVPPEAMPYRTALLYTYDSGNFPAILKKCADAADWNGFEHRRQASEAEGSIRGIGIAYAIEIAGGPADKPFEEYAKIEFTADGGAIVYAGSHSQGQGHETNYLQMAQTLLGTPADAVQIVYGDTDKVTSGRGTFGSRTMMAYGAAFSGATGTILAKARSIAAHLMETDLDAVEFRDGRFFARDSNRNLSLSDIAIASFDPDRLPPAMEPGLEAEASVSLDKATFPNGCHICEVVVDPQTGSVEIVSYIVVDDVGVQINPMLVNGQIVGGVVQGIGQIMSEQIVYSEDGQVLTGSFMDYGMPRADDVPTINVLSHGVPTTTNPLGVKGAGEAGTVGALAAVSSAIKDALRSRGVDTFEMPATPMRVWNALNAAGT
ncbi:xanthine dehydrogenase family protein molybdopterin-binding subunit [Oryzicola mucosus]|nr:xanthine dehydrogenase family protein molybdopterin-binding subunit [Oryzicola mucosus]